MTPIAPERLTAVGVKFDSCFAIDFKSFISTPKVCAASSKYLFNSSEHSSMPVFSEIVFAALLKMVAPADMAEATDAPLYKSMFIPC